MLPLFPRRKSPPILVHPFLVSCKVKSRVFCIRALNLKKSDFTYKLSLTKYTPPTLLDYILVVHPMQSNPIRRAHYGHMMDRQISLLPLHAVLANVMSLSWSHDRVTNFNVSYPDF